MASILLLSIGLAVAVALIGSVAIQFLTPDETTLSPQEQKCQLIADEGYRIHALYPDSNPDDLLEEDRKRLLYLDNIWMNDCVSVLSAESIFSIVNNVERDFTYGE